MKRKDEEHQIQELLLSQLRRGEISRRQFLQNMMMAGLGLGGVSVLSSCGTQTTPAPEAPAAAATEAPAAAATEEAAAAASRASAPAPTDGQAPAAAGSRAPVLAPSPVAAPVPVVARPGPVAAPIPTIEPVPKGSPPRPPSRRRGRPPPAGSW